MTCQFAFLKERNIICPWINFISQLPWKFWKCLLIIANLQGVICAVKCSVAKVTFCTGAKTLTRACPPIGTAVDNIWLTFRFVLTDNTSVSDSSVVSPYIHCLRHDHHLHSLRLWELVGWLFSAPWTGVSLPTRRNCGPIQEKKNDPAKRPVRCRME